MFRPILPVLALLLLAAPDAGAQQLRGEVSDVTTGEGLEGTLVLLLDADSAVRATAIAGEGGAFVVRAPLGKPVHLRVQRLGYGTQRSVPLLFEPGDSLRVQIGMRPEPVSVEGVTVTAIVNRDLERFLRDERMGFGKYLGPEEIARINPTSTSHLLVGMTSSPLKFNGASRKLISRSRDRRGGGVGLPPNSCVPYVYVDGRAIAEEHAPGETRGGHAMPIVRERGIAIESIVSPKSVRAVAVYPNPFNAPAEYQRAFMDHCPIVVIWTDYGFGQVR